MVHLHHSDVVGIVLRFGLLIASNHLSLSLGTLRSSMVLSGLFFFLSITFMLLMIGQFMNNVTIIKTGGGFGILTAAFAFYAASAGIYTPDSG